MISLSTTRSQLSSLVLTSPVAFPFLVPITVMMARPSLVFFPIFFLTFFTLRSYSPPFLTAVIPLLHLQCVFLWPARAVSPVFSFLRFFPLLFIMDFTSFPVPRSYPRATCIIPATERFSSASTLLSDSLPAVLLSAGPAARESFSSSRAGVGIAYLVSAPEPRFRSFFLSRLFPLFMTLILSPTH